MSILSPMNRLVKHRLLVLAIGISVVYLLWLALAHQGRTRTTKTYYESGSKPFLVSLGHERNPPLDDDISIINRGFVTALRYSSGQQGSGVKALHSLQCWAGALSVPMSILEPVIHGSEIVSTLLSGNSENVLKSQKQLMFSDFFDIDYFNSVAMKNSLAELATREEFFQNARRKIILVQMDWVSRSTPENQRHTEVLWPADSNSNLQRCFRHQDQDNFNLSQVFEVSKLLDNGYCIVKVVVSPASTNIFSQSDLTSTIYGTWGPSQVTVVFSLWRAKWKVPVTQNAVSFCNSENPFLPSPRIERDVESYEKQFLGHKNTLTIMFRFERMVQLLHEIHQHKSVDGKMIEKRVDECLSTVVSTVQSIQNKQTHYTKPFITLDLGVFGSSSWEQRMYIGGNKTQQLLTTKVNKILSPLFKNKWSFKEWESSFTKATGGISNSGYIAALQRTLASRAECLVLVGGGNFQEIALRDYFQRHPDKGSKCVHLVCVIHENILRNMILN